MYVFVLLKSPSRVTYKYLSVLASPCPAVPPPDGHHGPRLLLHPPHLAAEPHAWSPFTFRLSAQPAGRLASLAVAPVALRGLPALLLVHPLHGPPHLSRRDQYVTKGRRHWLGRLPNGRASVASLRTGGGDCFGWCVWLLYFESTPFIFDFIFKTVCTTSDGIGSVQEEQFDQARGVSHPSPLPSVL